jgi:hypothetical protein
MQKTGRVQSRLPRSPKGLRPECGGTGHVTLKPCEQLLKTKRA